MRTPTPWLLPTEPTGTRQLLAIGVSKEMLTTQLRTGRLLRLRRGVYLTRSAWPDDGAGQHLLLAQAELVAHPGAVLSHQSAAVAWNLPAPGFDRWHDRSPSITLPAGGGHRTSSGSATRHVADLPHGDVVRHPGGFAVTSLARTAIDLAAGTDLPEALVVLDAAARKLVEGFVSQPRRPDYVNPKLVEAARGALVEVAERRRRSLLPAIDHVEPSRESAPESLSAGHFILAGLPKPECQALIRTPSGPTFPDFWWSALRVAGECDGAGKYSDAQAFAREKEREQLLEDLGISVVRWLAKEIMLQPNLVVDRVSRELSSRS